VNRILRIDKPKVLQRVLCFFNFYHSYKYWSGGIKQNNEYAHFRRCTTCNKLQIQTFYQAGCNMKTNDWEKVDANNVSEP